MSNLQPGLEMDAAVARALGWFLADDNVWESPDGACHVLCHWSTDNSCAVRDLLPEIERRGWYYSIDSQVGGGVSVRIDTDEMTQNDEDAVIASELAEALCRAFLEAKEKTI